MIFFIIPIDKFSHGLAEFDYRRIFINRDMYRNNNCTIEINNAINYCERFPAQSVIINITIMQLVKSINNFITNIFNK